MIKTFRGLLASDEMDRIRLSTKKGKVGYKIIKFEVIAQAPGATDMEGTVTINKVTFTPDTSIDLSDGNILGVAYWHSAGNIAYPDTDHKIIFEQEVFNQDIYVGYKDLQGVQADKGMNYYIELETFTMSDNATAVSTLRDIRLNPQVGE
jgi:hypothetical protein